MNSEQTGRGDQGRVGMVRVDVLCVGHAAFDLVMTVDHHPGPDEKCFAEALITCGGGPASNAAVTVARLGGTSAFCGYLGEDLWGGRHLEELAAAGVRTDLVVRGPHPTPLSAILVKPDGTRTVVNHKAATPPLEVSHVPMESCRASVVLFDGHEPSLSVPFAVHARRLGLPAVLDAGSVHPGTTELAPLVDYLVASERFARDFTGEADPHKALEHLSRVSPVAVVTLGERGVIWRSSSEGAGMRPAFLVSAIDTTGAGDVFHGAFALGVARKEPLDRILMLSSAAAALSCTQVGARLGIPDRAAVDAFLETSSLRPGFGRET